MDPLKHGNGKTSPIDITAAHAGILTAMWSRRRASVRSMDQAR